MVKEKTLTIELSHENPLGDGYFYAMLDLPAEEYEIRDAIQRARMIGREESFRSIGILDCGAWPELLYYRLDSPTIDELNFFANRIAQMDDSELAIFRTVAPKVLGSPADDLLSMKDLINCTYGYDEIMVASNIRTDEQLGQFIIENELHDDVNNIPESSLYLLDKAKIGALYRTSLNCDLTDGYAIFAGDYKPPEIYDGKQLPDTEVEDWYAFRLQIAPPPTEDVSEVEDKAVWITLPMARQAADRIARELGVGSIEECVYLDFESSVPQITADQFGDMRLFDKLNGLAEKLPYLSPQEQMKFKAVLSAEHPADLDDIGDVIANLNKYELSAYVDSDSDFFKSYLEHHLGIGFDHKWLGGLFAKDEGARLLERLGATNTDYGVISARGGTLHDLVPYDEAQAKELTTQALTDEKLEVVEVLGQTALFTNGRVTEQELPEGLYRYDLRSGEGITFATVEPYARSDHSGTILVKAPLSFGSEGYIAFDDDTSPNFLGYELTPTEFMETDFTQSDDEDLDEDEDETQTIQMGGISQ